MKLCRGCETKKPLRDFYEHKRMADGHLNVCKECVKRRVRTHYADTIEQQHAYEKARNAKSERKARLSAQTRKHREANPLKYKARTAVGNALRDGRLTRGLCRFCGAKRVQAHHVDYTKPLEVLWECFKCHREHDHGQTVTMHDFRLGAGPRKRRRRPIVPKDGATDTSG